MALGIVKTLNNWLNMWPQGVNPGAGTQDPNTIGDGLNDQWKRIDLAVLTEHNTNGTHKSAVIDGANLKTTCFDGASIEQDSGTKKAKVKLLGIVTGMLADLCVTAAKMADATITAAKLASGCVTTAKLDQTGGSEAVTTACIRDDNVTAAKIPHDCTRTKIIVTLGATIPADSTTTYFKVNGFTTTDNLGIVFHRPGCITAITCCYVDGTVDTQAQAYSTTNNNHFVAGDRITVVDAGGLTGFIRIRKNAGNVTQFTDFSPNANGDCIATLEIEFDD